MPPPNTPEEGLLDSHTPLALTPFTRNDTASPHVDLRALEYEGAVDENLICPICRVPLIDPVITKCEHVFCRHCLLKAHSNNPICPIDRLPLALGLGANSRSLQSAPKIILNQLDNVKVHCPNKPRGCDLVVARSLIENHVNRYCDKTMVACPHPNCDQQVIKKDVEKGCLHYDVDCEYCEEKLQKVNLEVHQDTACPNRMKECEKCGASFIRHKQDNHNKECPEAETPCKFSALGCTYVTRRKDLEDHILACDYRVVGPVGDLVADLRTELKALQEKDKLQERRLRFLESRGVSVPAPTLGEALPDIGMQDPPSSEAAPYESRDQYFLSLFEAMESKVERMSNALNELEGRSSMMLFNETLQIKDQLTEIRSTLGVLGMHVRWLMNFRLQERGRTGVVGGTGLPPGGATSNTGPGGDSPFPRRLSDTLRENPPRL